MIIFSWNVRGLVKSSTQNEVLNLTKKYGASIFGVMETRLNSRSLGEMMNNRFGGWQFTNNFDQHPGGRIVVAWDPSKVAFNPTITTAQLIHGKLFCLVRKIEIEVSFVYALNNLVKRRNLWSSLSTFGMSTNTPWALVGDFNNVLYPQERVNGAQVTMYETKDFLEMCSANAIEDLPFHGPLLTWTNNSVWSKLDRAMVNGAWLEAGLVGHVELELPGHYSDHAYLVMTLIDSTKKPKPPFRFFNMWTKHTNYLEVVKSKWEVPSYGTKQFQLASKLRALKPELKALNEKHFSHISERFKKANIELVEAQARLHDDPCSEAMREQVGKLRNVAVR